MKVIILSLVLIICCAYNNEETIEYKVNPSKISLHWKTSYGAPIKSFGTLFVNNPNLVFATNGGMFGRSIYNEPLGLYVENGKQLRPIKKVNNSKYNFGMQPQAIFLITNKNKAQIIPLSKYQSGDVKYAVQSAPMLIMNNTINPKLTKSTSTNIRNGVGVLPNGDVLLIVSKKFVTFQEFAKIFKDRGCVSAMYLDGAISNGLTPATSMFDVCECYGSFIAVSK